ncbi:CHAP domain-containing protein [Cohnella silvisoli]|uniref:CHAP domain-containing protein n=1 Tax=Cohnella silvisoli TaxID=2873699 RepID=A0ABV1KVF9_9BACL|nr:CHAP domain-containing protein [Cohnella silvisoli]MCD9023457.1 CHAP domain-containing protein [Cohnella silvisoli]
MTSDKRQLLANIAEKLAQKPIIGNEHQYGPDIEPLLLYFDRSDKNIGFPWCAAFVYHCSVQAGFGLPVKDPRVKNRFASVHAWLEWSKLQGYYYPVTEVTFKPDRGDLIIYDDIDGNGPHDHIGVVLGTEEEYIITAEGNVKNKSGIFRRDRFLYINGYVRIDNSYRY